jgi:hypothetical protein
LNGLAPWLELGPANTAEGKIRGTYIDLAIKSLSNAVNLDSPDHLNFNNDNRPLLNGSLLEQGALTQLWNRLVQQRKRG